MTSPVPRQLADEAHRRIEAALANTQPSAPERVSVVSTAVMILHLLGETDRVKAILEKEITTAAAPYYYMSEMADLEEKAGNKDAALQWFRRAYLESKGRATRFDWGVQYVSALIRLKPEDASAVRDAAIEVLAELQGPDRLHGLTRGDLRELEAELRKWSAGDIHEQALEAIRERMDGICEQIPATEPTSRKACAEFLAQQKA